MKLVSDFDGVWTSPEEEARAQGEVLDGLLAAWMSDRGPEEAAEWIRAARGAALSEPRRFGWAPGGRLSAFGDEDPFAAHSALIHYLALQAEAGNPLAARLRDAALERFGSLDRLGGHTHAEGVKRVAGTRGPGVLPSSAEAGRSMLGRGVDVVVVSNSGTDKLARWFGHASVPNVVHPERRKGTLRLRGNAQKFVLDPERTDPLDLGGVAIETARPAYAAILADEKPDAIVGDVFSLDLALPLRLKRRGGGFEGLRLFWLMQPYTPAWLRESVRSAAGDAVEEVDGGLAGVAQRLAGSA